MTSQMCSSKEGVKVQGTRIAGYFSRSLGVIDALEHFTYAVRRQISTEDGSYQFNKAKE